MAFARALSINEMFLKAINDAYFQRKKQGLIRNAWPKTDLQIIKMILGVQTVEEAIVQDLNDYEINKGCEEQDKFKFNGGQTPEERAQKEAMGSQ